MLHLSEATPAQMFDGSPPCHGERVICSQGPAVCHSGPAPNRYRLTDKRYHSIDVQQHGNLNPADAYRNLLISLRLLNLDQSIRYSGRVPKSRWGEAIAFYLTERGWTQRQLAEKASARPNTLTNLVKHGRDSDTATLARVAAALQVDIAELFLTREQIEILRAHRENRIERLKEAVLKELSETVNKLVRREFEKLAKSDPEFGGRRRSSPSKR